MDSDLTDSNLDQYCTNCKYFNYPEGETPHNEYECNCIKYNTRTYTFNKTKNTRLDRCIKDQSFLEGGENEQEK